MEDLISRQEIQTVTLIQDEVKHKEPECHEWLKGKITTIRPDDEITQEAFSIQQWLGGTGARKNQKGVSENDIFLIAAAKIRGMSIIANEAPQAAPPKKRQNYKIPLVCSQEENSVPCRSFINFVKNSGARF